MNFGTTLRSQWTTFIALFVSLFVYTQNVQNSKYYSNAGSGIFIKCAHVVMKHASLQWPPLLREFLDQKCTWTRHFANLIWLEKPVLSAYLHTGRCVRCPLWIAKWNSLAALGPCNADVSPPSSYKLHYGDEFPRHLLLSCIALCFLSSGVKVEKV